MTEMVLMLPILSFLMPSYLSMIDQSQIATCVIVEGELTFMIENSQKQKSNLAHWK